MGAASSPCWSPQLLPAAACPCVTCPAANACRLPQLAARGLHSWPMHPAAAAPSCCVCSLPVQAAAPREPAPLLLAQAAPQLPVRLDCSHLSLAALRAAHVSRSHRFPPPTPLVLPRASALAGPPAAKPERPRTRRSRAPRARGSCSRNRSQTCEG